MDVDAPIVVLHGDNAQGKTNFLEAIYVLSTLKSFRDSRPSRWMTRGAAGARIQAKVQIPDGERTLTWRLEGNNRKLEIDEAPVTELSQWFSHLQAVVFCPEDGAIVRGEPDKRRRFLDRAAFTARPTHLAAVQTYRRILKHKSALLRSPEVDLLQLEIWDEKLAQAGADVIRRRREVLAELNPHVQELHQAIASSGDLLLRLRCAGLSSQEEMEDDELEKQLHQAIGEARSSELDRRQVLVGPHRDELVIELDGDSARNFASQGQARSIVLALKLAEVEAARARSQYPLFLLDDFTSELDRGRRNRLLEVIQSLRGQVWITTTDPAFLGTKQGEERLELAVESGRLHRG